MRTYQRAQRLLTVKDLNLAYQGRQILRNINLTVDNIIRPDVNQGQVIALLGPSGVGKTQLFRCIAGLQAPTSGAVLLNDNKHPVKAGEVGVVQQAYPLLQHRTVFGNLLLAAKRGKRKNPKQESMALLERFGMADKANKYPIQLSGGQKQRVAIIQQMLCSNYFLLMDEPFSGLDVIAKSKVCELINEVSTSNELNTIIVTTHNLESAVDIADTIWILGREEGKEGAVVRAHIDLIERGLAWNPDIQNHPNYWETVKEMRALFKTL